MQILATIYQRLSSDPQKRQAPRAAQPSRGAASEDAARRMPGLSFKPEVFNADTAPSPFPHAAAPVGAVPFPAAGASAVSQAASGGPNLALPTTDVLQLHSAAVAPDPQIRNHAVPAAGVAAMPGFPAPSEPVTAAASDTAAGPSAFQPWRGPLAPQQHGQPQDHARGPRLVPQPGALELHALQPGLLPGSAASFDRQEYGMHVHTGPMGAPLPQEEGLDDSDGSERPGPSQPQDQPPHMRPPATSAAAAGASAQSKDGADGDKVRTFDNQGSGGHAVLFDSRPP